ncbi:MAG: PBP1A family penicillin-binding protein [Patescibacteria group bacterium]
MKRRVFSPRRDVSWHSRRLVFRASKKNRSGWLWRLFFILLAVGAVTVIVVFLWVARDLPTPEGIAHRIIPQSTKIYDRTGETVLFDIHGEERRTSVELSNIPEHLKQATLVAEDRNFYTHQGFKFTSMVRSLLVNLIRGGKAQGGSTITQQFIKNAIVGGEKKYSRKIKEIILAYQIEQKFSKDEILKLYFNEIPYGSNAYGAEAAAHLFFGKGVKDINLAEAAILAALPKAPSYYSPWGIHKDELIGRQQFILNQMVEGGYIDQAAADQAIAEELNFITRQENIIAPHFVFYIKEQVADNYGERQVEQGGLKIITTLDLEAQKAAEEAIAESEEKNESFNAGNASLTAIDISTGQIIAMVGSRDFFNDDISGQVNVATRPRQPGSSFKPFVYAAAFDKGYPTNTLLFDVVTRFKTDTKDYTPHNYDSKERGPVTLRQALAGSLNIPAVKLLYLTGIDHVLDLAKQLGYTTLTERSRFGLSLVLGGAEIKLLEHVNAYATLARQGQFKPTSSILKIEDATGKILEEYKEPKTKKILEQQIANEVTDILADNSAREYIFGANNYLTLGDRPAAAKTGTTNDYRDAWTIGYTPGVAAGVWVGNSDNSEMKRGADGSVVAAPIWLNFMQKLLKGKPVEEFTAPEERLVDKLMLNGQLTGGDVLIDRASGKLATELTPSTFIERRRFRQYHTILHYLDKNNPLSNNEFNPFTDPQYTNWEEAVTRWTEEQGFSNEQPPTEYDDVHIAANRPELSLTNPRNNDTITSNPVTLSVNTSARRGVRRVEYLLDNQLIGESKQSPFSFTFSITDDWDNGFHTLTGRAYDDVDNMAESQSTFNLLVTPLPSPYHINWLSPKDGTQISFDQSPIELKLSLDHPELLEKIDAYYKKDQGASIWLGFVDQLKNEVNLSWQPAEVGNYTLFLVLRDTNGITKTTKPITIIVE